MIEGIVPNFSNPITCTLSDHNALPKSLRYITACSVVSFKTALDCYLKNIVYHPYILGFSNSLDAGDCIQWGLL